MITSRAFAINNRPEQLVITSVFSINGYPRTVREFFQSYGKIIAMKLTVYKKGKDYPDKKETFLDKNYWDYSNTTGKYRNIFLAEQKKVTENKIRLNDYELTDLN